MNTTGPSQRSAGENLASICGNLVVINLPFRVDRRAEFVHQLARIGLSEHGPRVRFFDAIRPQHAEPFPSVGAHGCFMSHLGVLREALAAGTDRLLICEDDLDFAKDFNSRSTGILAALDRTDWGIFYGFPPKNIAGIRHLGEGLAELKPETGIICSHFIALRRPVIEALVPFLEDMLGRPAGDPDGGPMHVDGAYNWFRQAHPDIRTLVAAPALAFQRASRTDIAELSLKDRLPVVRHVIRGGRKLKNWLS